MTADVAESSLDTSVVVRYLLGETSKAGQRARALHLGQEISAARDRGAGL